MFKFFDWIVNTISSLVEFLWTLIKGLIQLISLLPLAVNLLTNSIGVLPSLLVAFATATITISVIFILVGRSAGGKNG